MKHLKNAKEVREYREANTPEACPILGHASFVPVLDHSHQTGLVRGVLSREGNILEGKVRNAFRRYGRNAVGTLPQVLRRLAKYLEETANPRPPILHPTGLNQITRKFLRLPVKTQRKKLTYLGADAEQINRCRNAKARATLYKKLLRK